MSSRSPRISQSLVEFLTGALSARRCGRRPSNDRHARDHLPEVVLARTPNIHGMSETKYRMTFALLGLAFAAVVAGAVVFAPDGRPTRLPDAIESISPASNEIVLPQAALRIDMLSNYEIDIYVDGILIPAGEITLVAETGLHTWQPSEGRVISQWRPGRHTVQVNWTSNAAIPDVGDYRWAFDIR